jgi:hypothetical protein
MNYIRIITCIEDTGSDTKPLQIYNNKIISKEWKAAVLHGQLPLFLFYRVESDLTRICEAQDTYSYCSSAGEM